MLKEHVVVDKAFTYNTHTHLLCTCMHLLFIYLYVVLLPSNNPGHITVTNILLRYFSQSCNILYSIFIWHLNLRSEWLILEVLHYKDMVCVYMYVLGIKLQNVQTVLRHFLCFHFLFHLSPSSWLPVVGHAQFPWNLASLQHSLQLLHLFQTLSTGNGLLQHTHNTLHLKPKLDKN